MGLRPRAKERPFSTFGWSFTGALLIALSLPPLGFYPLAWVGLVPLLVRWSVRPPSVAYVRELYALLLTTSCCVGFWVLFNPDASEAASSGLSLFLVPIPLVAAFVLAGVIKERYGIRLGLIALVPTVLAAEFLVLRTEVGIPWLLLGHTQVGAAEFIQMADLGGVAILTAWVLLLNVAAFLILPQTDRPGERYGERGMSMAFFTALVALPVAYGAVRTAQSEVPAGHTRIGIVQPGTLPETWASQDTRTRVDYLATLSDDLFVAAGGPDSAASGADLASDGIDLLLWPQSSIAPFATEAANTAFSERIRAWCERRDVALLAGGTTAMTSDPYAPAPSDAVLLVRPEKGIVRYAESTADEAAVRLPFAVGGIRVGVTFGAESLYGSHVREVTKDGADLVVALSDNGLWGRSQGLQQQLQFTRLRAIESRRAIALSTVGGVSALIHPSGAIEPLAGWMEQGSHRVDVPTFRGETFYVRYGDWIGVGALVFCLAYYTILSVLSHFVPEVIHKPAAKRRRPALA